MGVCGEAVQFSGAPELGCQVVPFTPLFRSSGCLINPFKQNRAPFFNPRLLGKLGRVLVNIGLPRDAGD